MKNFLPFFVSMECSEIEKKIVKVKKFQLKISPRLVVFSVCCIVALKRCVHLQIEMEHADTYTICTRE